jgi:hypothetical protein
MTRKQFLQKVRELNRTNSKAILERAEKVLSSGCLDLEAYGSDSYLLPKSFMSACCSVMAGQWLPFGKENRATAWEAYQNCRKLLAIAYGEVENIELFI